jgi:hypothetical protein
VIFDNKEVKDIHNEDDDAMEKEGNNNDKDFVLITMEGLNIGEDYWDSTEEDDDDPNYDMNEHIEQHMIVKGGSEINEINVSSRVQLDNPLSENQTFNSKKHLQYTINEYHIRGNIEVKTKRTSKINIGRDMQRPQLFLEVIYCMS